MRNAQSQPSEVADVLLTAVLSFTPLVSSLFLSRITAKIAKIPKSGKLTNTKKIRNVSKLYVAFFFHESLQHTIYQEPKQPPPPEENQET